MRRFCLSSLTEKLSAGAGIILIGYFIVNSFLNAQAANSAITSFLYASTLQSAQAPSVQDKATLSQQDTSNDIKGLLPPVPDQTLWSESAKKKYANLPQGLEPMAVISIPKFSLDVPIYMGTSEENLDRGAGWVEYTAAPREHGNIGIAGHRDSWFRPLKDIKIGDRLILHTRAGAEAFQVTQLQIVDPEDTQVLRDTHEKTVTLITCYPFYYVGSAPERFVVSAQYIDQPKSGD